REILGPEFYDKFFQLVDPEGRPGARSTHLREETLPLSAQARRDAARGEPTFETVRLATGEPVRLLTLPITRDGQLVQLVQVGMLLERAQRTLGRYLETLLVLIPLGLTLAAAGGAVIARSVLRPVDTMSRTDRKSTRLNSSHGSISYAVFCLKKKIKVSKAIKRLSNLRSTR